LNVSENSWQKTFNSFALIQIHKNGIGMNLFYAWENYPSAGVDHPFYLF
jgi:hypothetical protein